MASGTARPDCSEIESAGGGALPKAPFDASSEGEDGNERCGKIEEIRLSASGVIEDNEDDWKKETACGIGGCRPRWLQRFARAELYAVMHGVLGLVFSANYSYFSGILSNLEKHLKISSKKSAFIRSAFEVGAVMALPVMGYTARHASAMRLLTAGTFMTALATLGFAAPHFVFGAGAEARAFAAHAALDAFPGNSSAQVVDAFCGMRPPEDCEETDGIGGHETFVSSVILFLSSMLMGIGNSAHFSVGLSYLDNNSSKNMSPILLAVSSCLFMLGPSLGFWVASLSLAYYVDPSVTPPFNNMDPRWIGAWWLGLPFLGMQTAFMGVLVAMFPRRLPRAAARQRQLLQAGQVQDAPSQTPSIRDLKQTLWRLVSNKVLVFNTCASIFLSFGYEGYFIFMPKYIEAQFRQTASKANLITGSVGLVFTGAGMVGAALFITKFKPRPRSLAAWNVFTELLDVLGHFAWAFVGCAPLDMHGAASLDGSWNLTAPCNADCVCGPEVKFSPVCSLETGTTFYSPFHAGCTSSYAFSNGTKAFAECSCIPTGAVVDGSCVTDCGQNFTVFLVMRCALTLLQASGRSGNVLLAFRCVDETDKSCSIALAEFLLCIFAFFPAQTSYGALLDVACLVWGVTCGKTGHCWFYDDKKMRYLMNFTSAGFLLVGLLFDVCVWVHCSGLKLYDEDHKLGHNNCEETTSIMAMEIKNRTEETTGSHREQTKGKKHEE